MFVRRLTVAAAFGVLSLLAPLAAHGTPCRFFGMNAGAPVWNGAIILDDAYAAAIAGAGAHAVRVNFRIDTAGQWDAQKLAQYDLIVGVALAHGLEVLGLIGYEATLEDQASWNDDPDGDGFNAYVDAFASVSELLISHFVDRVKSWEIWNEPNCWANSSYVVDPGNAGCSYILPRVFAKIFAEVYVRNQAALSAGGASLVLGGLLAHDIDGSFSTATDYLDELYAAGVWDWLDANHGRRYPWDMIGYHIYIDQGGVVSPAVLHAYADAVRATASNRGDASPITLTEIGWSTDDVTESVQAIDLMTTYGAMAQRTDVEQTFWFTFRDTPGLGFGITNASGTDKAAVAAMQASSLGCTSPRPEPSDAGSIEDAEDARERLDAEAAGDAMPMAGDGGRDDGAAHREGGARDAGFVERDATIDGRDGAEGDRESTPDALEVSDAESASAMRGAEEKSCRCGARTDAGSERSPSAWVAAVLLGIGFARRQRLCRPC